MSSSLMNTAAQARTNYAADTQDAAPFAEAVNRLAEMNWQRLHVPGHQSQAPAVPELTEFVGDAVLQRDFPMSAAALDHETWLISSGGARSPLERAAALAAEACGASRTWFVTNGGSGCNHIATTVARGLGREAIVQRSVHSSVIDGIAHVGLAPHFVHPAVDPELGAAHGVTAEQVRTALQEHANAASVYLVSPSYFGVVADVAAIAEVAHRHGVPLIIDEAWGAHFGYRPQLPTNAIRLGADLVISSTHKGAGALTQAAMLHLGTGPQARKLESLVDRVARSYQSTSSSALLLASLDLARRRLVTGTEAIDRALDSAQRIRLGLAVRNRFDDATDQLLATPDAAGYDPLKIVIDMRASGITGTEAHHWLIAHERINCELATSSTLVLLIGATAPADADRFLQALDRLPVTDAASMRVPSLPPAGPRRLEITDAFFRPTELVPADEAIGRISADSLAAYPPGIPNTMPGEELTADVVRFLRNVAAQPSGYVRGAADPQLSVFRVVR